jgi:hypothetical protein
VRSQKKHSETLFRSYHIFEGSLVEQNACNKVLALESAQLQLMQALCGANGVSHFERRDGLAECRDSVVAVCTIHHSTFQTLK